MPVRTVSQKFCNPQWGRIFKELWGRPTTITDFGSSFRQIPYTSNVCLLEEKIQDWGMYLFTISYGSDALDQRSGDDRFSGCSVKSSRSIEGKEFPNFEMLDARIASAVNKIIQNSHLKKKVSLEEQNAQKEDRFIRGRQMAVWSSWDRSWLFGFILYRSSKRWCSGLRHDGMQFFCLWPRSHLMTSWKVYTNWEYVSLIKSKPY